MGGPQNTRHIGGATRIYKNSDGEILAVDEIAITADTQRVTSTKWFRSAHASSKRCLMHFGSVNRTITTIEMIGDYSSVTYDSGNYQTGTWEDSGGGSNDIEIGWTDLPVIGDTI